MPDQTSTDDVGVIGPDRVRNVFQGLLRAAQTSGWTDEGLAAASGVKARRIKAYRVEGKEPSVSAMLSIAVVLGRDAINSILALIGYGGASPLDEPDEISPGLIVAEIVDATAPIARAAADGRIDHIEKPITRAAADRIIAAVLPLSSMADAG